MLYIGQYRSRIDKVQVNIMIIYFIYTLSITYKYGDGGGYRKPFPSKLGEGIDYATPIPIWSGMMRSVYIRLAIAQNARSAAHRCAKCAESVFADDAQRSRQAGMRHHECFWQ